MINLSPDESILNIETKEEHPNWLMYFGGAVDVHKNELGAILISLAGKIFSGHQIKIPSYK